MLIKAKTLKSYKLRSLDGEIGKIDGFYFDDRHLTIRYLVVDTGNWLTGRQVLISPYALTDVNQEEQYIIINLTKKQIEDSPPLDSNKAISRQFENAYHGYYGWPMYWIGPYTWGYYPIIVRNPNDWREYTPVEKVQKSHLRSTNEVSSYEIQAEDGEIGHIEDFIIDDEMWAIRYLVIDTRNWWPGRKVLVSSKWIKRISWNKSEVLLNLLREAIKKSPEYTDETLLTKDYEAKLH